MTSSTGVTGRIYVRNPDADVRTEDWSIEDFTNQHLAAYIQRCAAWRERYEHEEQVS